MPECNKNISVSTLRKKIRRIWGTGENRQGSQSSFSPGFIPFDLKVWLGCDSDFFRRSFCHHRMILKFILSGRATTCIEGVRYELSPGDAVLYFPMQTHSTELLEGYGDFEYLAFSFIDGLGKYEALDVLRNRVFTPDREGHFLPEIVQSIRQGDPIHGSLMLGEMLAKCVAEYAAAVEPPGGGSDERFRQSLECIRKHSCEEISVKTLGDRFGLSPQTVRRIFRKYVSGMSPGTLLRRQRLTLAQDLLERTELNLEKIAVRCGFATAFSFSRAFRKAYGISPGAYRKNKTPENPEKIFPSPGK